MEIHVAGITRLKDFMVSFQTDVRKSKLRAAREKSFKEPPTRNKRKERKKNWEEIRSTAFYEVWLGV